MTASILQQPGFYQFLTSIDTDLASWARIQGCSFCGGVFRSACYPRKPRGSGELETTAATTRHSFCCDECRRRTTPESVRFLGRRVYPGFVKGLLSAMQSGVPDKLINEYRSQFVQEINAKGVDGLIAALADRKKVNAKRV